MAFVSEQISCRPLLKSLRFFDWAACLMWDWNWKLASVALSTSLNGICAQQQNTGRKAYVIRCVCSSWSEGGVQMSELETEFRKIPGRVAKLSVLVASYWPCKWSSIGMSSLTAHLKSGKPAGQVCSRFLKSWTNCNLGPSFFLFGYVTHAPAQHQYMAPFVIKSI